MRRFSTFIFASSLALLAGAAKADTYIYNLPTSLFLTNGTVTPSSITVSPSLSLGFGMLSGGVSYDNSQTFDPSFPILSLTANLVITGGTVEVALVLNPMGSPFGGVTYGPGSYMLSTTTLVASGSGLIEAYYGSGPDGNPGTATFSNFVLTSQAPINGLNPVTVGAPLPALTGVPALAALGGLAVFATRRRRRAHAAV